MLRLASSLQVGGNALPPTHRCKQEQKVNIHISATLAEAAAKVKSG